VSKKGRGWAGRKGVSQNQNGDWDPVQKRYWAKRSGVCTKGKRVQTVAPIARQEEKTE